MLLADLELGQLPGRTRPLETDVIIRQSTIGSMQLCPGRVGLSLEPGFDPTPSMPMVRGSLNHAVTEEFLLGVEAGKWDGERWPLALMPKQVERLLTEIAQADGWDLSTTTTKEQRDKLCDEAVMLAIAWHEQLWLPELHQLNLVAIERRLVRPLGTLDDGRAVWLQGTPDLVTAGTIYDWKTAERPWKTNDDDLTKGSYQPQAPLYLWLAEGLTGEIRSDFTFCVGSLQGGATWTQYPTTWSPEAIQAALLNAWQYAVMIANQSFPFTPFESPFGKFKRGWWCSSKYCGAWNVCPGKNMIADLTDTEEVRDGSWAT